jgi:tetratricopeptide (TPR) repeat protein
MDWPSLAAVAVLAAVAALAYSGTFSVPLLYDDETSIASNASIHHLFSAFRPPADATVSGRPVLNLSLALNYAVSGTDVWSYHALNLSIHILSGLALFGIVRRTLERRAEARAPAIAFCAALLWVVHPLLTESVTYIVQRAESLMGLFYLLTLYAFIRACGQGPRTARAWFVLCALCCLLGMATKEVMATAPLVVFLYDRTFLSGSFREAWRRHGREHAVLAATWLILPFLVLSTHGRGGSAGFGSGVYWWAYGLTQLQAVVHYLRLSIWPSPLIFDYGSALAGGFAAVLPQALVVAALAAATAWALFRKPALGFLGGAFFVILAPSSSIVPVATETMAEHRMYLPLVPLVVLFVAGAFRWLGRCALPVCLVLAAGLLAGTWRRNEAYRSDEGIWGDTVAKRPGNERAQNNLGFALEKIPGRLGDSVARYEEALRLKPGYVEAHYNLGTALASLGRPADAIAQYREALRLNAGYAEAHYNLGVELERMPGRLDEAIGEYQAAVRLKPGYGEAQNNLGNALDAAGRHPEAIQQLEEALRLNPGIAETHCNLGNALESVGRTPEAVAEYGEALRLRPGYVEAHNNLGCALERIPGELPEAIGHFQEALRLDPGHVQAHYNLGTALAALGRTQEAMVQYEEALRLSPGLAEARYNLGNALDSLGRIPEAIAQYREALLSKPDDPSVLLRLAVAELKVPGGTGEAIGHLRAVIRVQPGNDVAREILADIGAPQR